MRFILFYWLHEHFQFISIQRMNDNSLFKTAGGSLVNRAEIKDIKNIKQEKRQNRITY